MEETRIEIFVKAEPEANGNHLAKIRKAVISGNSVLAKYGLSQKTGEWIRIAEGQNYPSECFFEIAPIGNESEDSRYELPGRPR